MYLVSNFSAYDIEVEEEDILCTIIPDSLVIKVLKRGIILLLTQLSYSNNEFVTSKATFELSQNIL